MEDTVSKEEVMEALVSLARYTRDYAQHRIIEKDERAARDILYFGKHWDYLFRDLLDLPPDLNAYDDTLPPPAPTS